MFFSLILGTAGWTPFDSPFESFLQGLVGACGISVLCNLLRVYNFIQTCNDSDTGKGSKRSSSSLGTPLRGSWGSALQFWLLTVFLSLMGSRVFSLIVLEFSLRAVSTWASAGLDASGRGLDMILIQSQFTLGCSLTSAMVFFQQGAPHSSLSLFLAAALSWKLASLSYSLWNHVARLYPLHSTKHYCGKCITLLTSGYTILASLQRAVVLAFAVACAASTTTFYDHFLFQKDTMKFWTLLTLCYIMLLVYIQEDEHRQKGTAALLHSVVMRLGALLVLMLAMGDWSDVLHILIAFLGEAVCLLPSRDLLQAVLNEEEETGSSRYEESSSCKRSAIKTSSRDR
ncbi:transmembrane protein 82-like isoform X2 [Archocentrus centrarchus]|uniref:transmembrane protein 82-like isoform X2 n=1 Tax=Archocentrus centrarchus TaxID=63155 RepID=UPI0011EA0076|nr:transmembrane protein 82-like isoform X2 [Archocentrus centrarchus]